MDALRGKLEKHKGVVVRDLDLNKQLLTLLSKAGILDITDCVQLQQIKDDRERNRSFLETVVAKKDDGVYVKLIDCLQEAGQSKVADRLIDISEEMHMLNNMQLQLNTQLKKMSDFLKTEERRAGVYLTEPQLEDDDKGPAMSEADVWAKIQESFQRSQQLLTRCQKVIGKLHKDCETVARQNADIIEYTKECDAKIKEVLSHGRKSAKHRAVPKKTQDIFESLMDDIEKLVRTRKKVLTKETEGRRHSTRIVRQCRDWLSGRCAALQKLNSLPSTGGRVHEPPGSDETAHHPKEAPPDNDNAIMSILESLQLLEKELQEYVHQEVALSDKYRAELRRKHLLKHVHGLSMHGFDDMDIALKALQKNPDRTADCIAVLETGIGEINKEYTQCLVFINKIVPDEELNGNGSSPSPRQGKKDIRTPRNLPDIFKTKTTVGGKPAKSTDGNTPREQNESNQLLRKIQILVSKYEDMKNDDQMLSSKHRSEMSRKKRDMDIQLQRKEDQIMKLQTQLKELDAEKEKYKKLYNDTKIGYQRNHEKASSPM